MQQHKKRRKVCYYCQNKLDAVDFKNTELLRKFVSDIVYRQNIIDFDT